MDINNYLNSFKRFALHEKGMKYRSFKAIQSSVSDLSKYYNTANFKKLNTQQIRVYLQETSQERGWAPKTYRNQRQALSTFYQWLLLQGFCSENPVIDIQKPRLPSLVPRALTKEQANVFLSAVRWYHWETDWQRIRNEAIVATFLFTGIRLNELIHLKVSDIDLQDDFILIRQGKMSKDRIVPIHPKFKSLLERFIKKRKREGDWLFTGAHSSLKLYPKNIHQIFKKVSKQVKIKCTPHMLRHTFGRLCVEAGLGLYKIKEIMGHSSVSTTQIYLSVSAKNLKESFGQVDIL